MLSLTNDNAATHTAAKPSALRLADTNINPYTGLATDCLNHFNEAIMLLEMLSEMPDCRQDFIAWQPMSYSQHFHASQFKDREIAIAAYAAADPARRAQLDALANTMNDIIMATREAVQLNLSALSMGNIANLAVRWLKPLVARAGAIINGTDAGNGVDGKSAPPQAVVDALMAR